jgi:hypothetical protein
MDLGDQRAGSIDNVQVACIGLGADGRGDAVRGEDQVAVLGNIGKIVGKDRTLFAQTAHHVLVMDDLVTNINRRSVNLKRHLHDLNCPIDSRTKSARRCQQYLHFDLSLSMNSISFQ